MAYSGPVETFPDRFPFASVLAVCAHPDDESFGLGATLSALRDAGVQTSVLCFTRGEASTLRATDGVLADVRALELRAAANALGVARTTALAYPDGALAEVAGDVLCGHIMSEISQRRVDCLLAFDTGGITGHPDHQAATAAAVMAGDLADIPVLAWTLAASTANALNLEFPAHFAGRDAAELDFVIHVDRRRQLEAILCHTSQSTDNPVLRRRLHLQGDTECLLWLRRPRPS